MPAVVNRTLAVIAAIAISAGCSQQKYEPAEKVAGGLQKAAAELSADQANVGNVLTTLNNLSAGSGDLRSRYDAFNKAVEKMTESAEETRDKAAEMKSRGQAFFANWDKESAAIQNEDIRQRSEARKAEVRTRFDRVRDLYQQAQAEFKPFQTEIADIRTALGTDLTPAGVNSVRDVIQRANNSGTALRSTLGKLADEFRALGASVSPAGG